MNLDYFQKFWFEYIIGALWVANAFVNHFVNEDFIIYIFLGLWLVLLILKGVFEGFRPFFMIYIMLEPFILLTRSLPMTLVVVFCVCIGQIFYVVYKLPKTAGSFACGFKTLKIKGNITVNLFYPVSYSAKAKEDCLNKIFFNQQLEKLYLYLKATGTMIPKFWLKLILSFTSKINLDVKAKAQTIWKNAFLPISNKLPAIVFSHGLGFTGNSYFAMSRELASNGYIILSIDHSDQIILSSTNVYQKSLQTKGGDYNKQILERVSVINQVLEWLENKDSLEEMFEAQQSQLQIDIDRISLIGHGIGGGAVYKTALKSNLVTGICALIDPDLHALPEEDFKSPIQNSLFVIRSQFYDQNHPELEIISNINKIISTNKNDNLAISCNYQGQQGHFSVSDLSIFAPHWTYGLKNSSKPNCVLRDMKLNNQLILTFLDTMLYDEERNQTSKKMTRRLKKAARVLNIDSNQLIIS